MNLAYRLRPRTLDEYVGQEHLVGEGKILRKMIEQGTVSSMIFWGPPGTGKTTLAHIIAKATNADFHQLSGVTSGKKELLEVTDNARRSTPHPNPLPQGAREPLFTSSPLTGEEGGEGEKSFTTSNSQKPNSQQARTILFIDEIHRWNKAQQDALLPYVESGLITLIGATTENPSFEVISALLSRSRVFVLKSLEQKELEQLIDRALTDTERGVGEYKKKMKPDAKELLIRLSGGDARTMLNALEIAVTTYSPSRGEGWGEGEKAGKKTQTSIITPEIIQDIFQTKTAGIYDKKADAHYDTISAFIKSMRGSDVDASLYYLMRMLENGEDPKFIARRMIIFASEDIGMADRGALIQANEAFEAVAKIGMPESQLILVHVVIYLASAKKSRAVPNALAKAKAAVYQFPNEPIPLHLRNAPTKLMSELGYAKDYEWSESHVGPKEGKSFLPEKLKGKKFYES